MVAALLCLLFSAEAYAYVGNGFIWNMTEIEIPVNSNFLSYLDQFEVQFYYCGQLTDEEVKVDVDEFYYGNLTISTSMVGIKTVKLIATVQGYSSFDRKDIIVHVVDNQQPEIIQLQPLIFSVNQAVSYENYFEARDNDEIASLIFNDENVNYSSAGTYTMKVIAIDVSGNRIEQSYNVSIVDKGKPTIDATRFIEVEYGDLDFDISEYASASDSIDGDLSSTIRVEGLDIFKLGSQEVKIWVVDSSGNQTVLYKKIEVVDTKAPNLELSTYFDTINIGDEIDFRSYVARVSDNCFVIDISNVSIDTTEFKNEFGSYSIEYKICDESYNYTIRYLTINVSYSEAPTIIANDLSFNQNEIFNLKDYISVSDPYDDSVLDTLIIDDSVLNRNKPGIYEVVIKAVNKAGLSTTKSIKVTIVAPNSESKIGINNIYDYIYENKLMFAIIIIAISGGLYYFLFRKKGDKLGE